MSTVKQKIEYRLISDIFINKWIKLKFQLLPLLKQPILLKRKKKCFLLPCNFYTKNLREFKVQS